MENLTQRHLRMLNLAVIVVSAGLLAHAAATMIRGELDRWVADEARRRLPRARLSSPVRPAPDATVTRNIFCSTCPVGPRPLPPSGESAPGLVRTTLPLRLLATVIAPPANARWSVAVIRDEQDRVAGPFAVGAQLRGAVITGIRATRVFLVRDQRREYLDLLEPGGSAASDRSLTTSVQRQTEPADQGIKKVGSGRYEIERATLDALLGNIDGLSRSVVVRPEVRNGRSIGLRLMRVDPGGPIARLGLMTGDVIASINGLDLSTPENALYAYTKLRSANHLEIGFERGGARVSYQYRIY